MAVYVDELRDWNWRLGRSCHLAADSLAELHAFAERLGMERGWLQGAGRRPHFDLTASRRKRAVALGAVETDGRGIVEACRRCVAMEEPKG